MNSLANIAYILQINKNKMHSPEIVMQSPQVVMQSPDVVMQTPESAVRTNTYSLRVRKSNTIDRDYSPPGQPTKKKPRVVQTTPNKKAPATKRAAAVQNKAAAVPAAQEDPYFQSLKSGKSVNVIIDKWMKLYDESPDQAIVQFLQIIVATCGCQGKLDANMIHNMEMKDIIARLSEAFDEDSGEYPLIMSSAQWKKFRLNFGDLLTLFIIRGKNTQIYDVTLMDSLIQLLTGLADTQIRAFRHTATFAAMKISSAIVDVVVELVDIRTKNARQIDTEKAKLDQMNVGSERLEMLLQQKEEIDSKIDELKSMIQYMFKSIFVHRYRDVVADIRTICIAELGNWIRVYPALFLEDTYLKYIGWSLCDKLADVRLRCVVALLPLYENFELIGNLELFTNKFKDRLASMVMDTESEVAIKACQLLTHIYRAFPALLTLKDCLPIYELVYCNNRQQAVAAAGFVSTKLFSPNLDGVQADNLQLLKDLVVFFRDGQVHNHTAYLVDSFIDSCPMLKDWGSMVKILLANEYYEHDNELISIMSTAVKQAATGEHPPNRIVISIRRGPGAGTEKKDMRLLREERQRISDVFIPTLPRLLAKFIADQDKVSNLLDIFLHLDLEMYSTGRHEQPLNELMQLFERIVEQYSNEEMIKQIGAIFQYMSTDLAVSQFTETARMRLIDSIALQLRHYLEQIQKYNLGTATADEQMETGGMDQEDEANLLSTYRKIIAFTAAIDIPSKWDFWEETIALLNSQKIKSEDLMEKAVLYCFQSLTWNIKRIVITQDFKEETIEMMKRRRDQFFVITRGIMRDMASGVENAFQCQCDLMILFNWKLAAGHDDEPEHPLHILSIRLDRETSDCITNFVLDNVFVEEGAQNNLNQTATIQMLNKRRNILAHYTKLYLFGLLPIINSAGILRFFHQYYNDFGDIFKHLLQECRKMDKVMTARAIIKALIYNYEEMKVTFGENVVDQDSEKFQSLRDLGRRFALSFGVDNIKNRDALALIHHNGIKYALQLDEFPPNRKDQQPQEQKFENFPFFEILQEFSPKLHRQDKLAVLRYLDKNCPQDKQIENNDDIWQTFQLYRSSLAKAEGGAE